MSTFSQVYSFKNFTEDDGLSQSFIYDICQDSRGFLVIATGDGLSAYGGYNFKTFKASSGLAEIGISALFKDSKNKLYKKIKDKIGTYVGRLHNDSIVDIPDSDDES